MALNPSERTQQLNQLSEFIKHTRNTLLRILNQLEWDEGHLQKQEKGKVSCPLNEEHHVPQEKLHQHVDSCSWRIEGYHNLDTPLPGCCETGFGSVTIGETLRNTILQEAIVKDPSMKLGFTGVDTRTLPKTADRLVADFTSDERRAMYDYAVARTGAVSDSKNGLPMEFQKDDDKKEKPKTMLEKLAEERDAKRRRVSYRNKKVHTNRKSQTEILREVIQNQMELYEEWLQQENKDIHNPSASEEQASITQLTDSGQERSSTSAVMEQRRDHTEASLEERKISNQYFAKLRRKKGNPYAVAREISNYLEKVSEAEESLDESGTKSLNQANLMIKYEDKITDRYQQQSNNISGVQDEYRHRRSRLYEHDRSYKSEKVYDSHYYSERRKNSSSSESETHRNPGVERYKSNRYYKKNSNTDYEHLTKYKEKLYSSKRERQSKYYQSDYKRDRQSSLETRRSDHRPFDEEHEKKNQYSEIRKQVSNEYPELSIHRKYAEATSSSKEKNDLEHYKKYRKEKAYEKTTEKRHRMESRSPEYRSARRKHKKHKHHRVSYREKHQTNHNSESSQESIKHSASDGSLSEESEAEHRANTRRYEEDISRNKMERKPTYEDHHKHKHKKKHKKKKKHLKHERKEESEHSTNDFSC